MFYLYEHCRPDTGLVFYVGKGTRDRLNTTRNRNRHWHNVVNKAGGFKSQKTFEHEDEELVLLAEVERIDQLKRLGYKLSNITNGGEGTSGMVHTPESRAKIGVKHSPESYARALEKRKLLKVSEATRKKQSLERIGHKNVMYGKTHSESAREKIRAARLNAPRITCPYCARAGDSANMKRWHFDNCKLKESNPMSKEKSPQVVTLDGVEFDANLFTEQQTLMLHHTIDLDRKINSTQFQLQQLQVGKDSFLKLLKDDLAQAVQDIEPVGGID